MGTLDRTFPFSFPAARLPCTLRLTTDLEYGNWGMEQDHKSAPNVGSLNFEWVAKDYMLRMPEEDRVLEKPVSELRHCHFMRPSRSLKSLRPIH